mgnify:CR=1 FL=1
MLKKFLFLIVLSLLANMNNIALSDILPLKKPTQTKEETQKKIINRCIETITKTNCKNRG